MENSLQERVSEEHRSQGPTLCSQESYREREILGMGGRLGHCEFINPDTQCSDLTCLQPRTKAAPEGWAAGRWEEFTGYFVFQGWQWGR